jgi:hypothetical protein
LRRALLALALLFCCARPQQLRYEEELREAPPPARHAVNSERLRQLMRGLERLGGDRLPRELDLRQERRRRAEELAAIALALAESAEQIPLVLGEVELEPAQREEFTRLAAALRARCLELAERAPELPEAELRARLDAVGESCDACHRRFRVLPAAPPL